MDWKRNKQPIRLIIFLIRNHELFGEDQYGADLEIPRIADTELESAAASVFDIAGDWNSVIEPERSQARDIEAQSKTVVVVIMSKVPLVRVGIDHTDIIEHREAKKFNNGNAIFGRAEPIRVAAEGFTGVVARADLAVAVAAQ